MCARGYLSICREELRANTGIAGLGLIAQPVRVHSRNTSIKGNAHPPRCGFAMDMVAFEETVNALLNVWGLLID